MEDIIQRWQKHAEKDQEENFLYIRSLKFKAASRVDHIAKQMHTEAFDKIDCLQCGNCCKVSKPLLLEEDIDRIASYLTIPKAQFISDYLEKDEDGDWTMNALPCSFLNEDDNKCKIYSVRPIDCQDFPHTHKEGFASRSHGHSYNTVVCPATYYIVERIKEMIG